MQERIHQQQAGSQLGQCVLFFGCRRSDQDFLYGQQLQQWADQGLLTLSIAFSRQQVGIGFYSGKFDRGTMTQHPTSMLCHSCNLWC